MGTNAKCGNAGEGVSSSLRAAPASRTSLGASNSSSSEGRVDEF